MIVLRGPSVKTGSLSLASVIVTVISKVSVRPAASVTVTVAVTEVVVSKSGAVAKLITPLASMVNRSPETEKVNVSLASTSVAVIVAFGIAV